MTTNAYIFMWDMYGIESIVPITQYENIDRDNTMRILADQPLLKNNVDSIVQSLKLRARFNTQRHYEIYAVDCGVEMTEEFWRTQWEEHPQETANLIRERGIKIYSDRANKKEVVIE